MRTEKAGPRKKSTAGRPIEITPDRLLDSAQTLFAERGFEGTTTRELAGRAKCNIATIAYHFGSKDGIYEAVLARHFKSMSARFADALAGVAQSESSLQRAWPELPTHGQRLLCSSLFSAGRSILLDDEMQKIISRELMAGGTKIAQLIQRNGGGFAGPLRVRLDELVANGEIRPGLDTKLGTISLVGPLIYSSIACPLIKITYGLEHDENYVRALCLHLTRTFFEGWSSSR